MSQLYNWAQFNLKNRHHTPNRLDYVYQTEPIIGTAEQVFPVVYISLETVKTLKHRQVPMSDKPFLSRRDRTWSGHDRIHNNNSRVRVKSWY